MDIITPRPAAPLCRRRICCWRPGKRGSVVFGTRCSEDSSTATGSASSSPTPWKRDHLGTLTGAPRHRRCASRCAPGRAHAKSTPRAATLGRPPTGRCVRRSCTRRSKGHCVLLEPWCHFEARGPGRQDRSGALNLTRRTRALARPMRRSETATIARSSCRPAGWETLCDRRGGLHEQPRQPHA